MSAKYVPMYNVFLSRRLVFDFIGFNCFFVGLKFFISGFHGVFDVGFGIRLNIACDIAVDINTDIKGDINE